MVPKKGLEPLHLAATASKTVMSTNTITWADSTGSNNFCHAPLSATLRGYGSRILSAIAESFRTAHLPIPSPGQIAIWCSRWDLNPHVLADMRI